MQQVFPVWATLGMRQRVIIVAATVAVMLAVWGLARMAAAPSFALLYAGLDEGAAGEVVQALESRSVPYEVRAGAIFVPAAERDSLRLTLASEGLPAKGTKGYELLDGLSGFGTTSQMFDAAYWRAKEGELARTIVSNPQVASARVHIATTGSNPFQRDVTPSASISVTTTGAALSAQQARALQYLVASAVPGLEAARVAVIDGKGGLIGSETDATPAATADTMAAQLRERAQRLIEARVGAGNAVVEVSVETVSEAESILERRFDPESRVVISTDTEESSENSQETGGGDVTVASNLPDGEAGGGENATAQSSETRERVNYEVSETTREITRAPGDIKRLSVAVLVNGSYETAADGTRTFVPLPDPELEALRALVGSAVGYDEARGDAITIRSLPFERPEGLGTGPITPGLFSGPLDIMQLAQMGVLALVALVLGLFVIRPLLARPAPGTTALPAALPQPESASTPALDGELEPIQTQDALPDLPMASGFGGMGMVDFDTPSEDPVERLRGLIEERKSETVEILRSWLDDKEDAR